MPSAALKYQALQLIWPPREDPGIFGLTFMSDTPTHFMFMKDSLTDQGKARDNG